MLVFIFVAMDIAILENDCRSILKYWSELYDFLHELKNEHNYFAESFFGRQFIWLTTISQWSVALNDPILYLFCTYKIVKTYRWCCFPIILVISFFWKKFLPLYVEHDSFLIRYHCKVFAIVFSFLGVVLSFILI